MQSDFLIPFRPPAENTAEKVAQAIDEKDQSEKEDSVKLYNKAMNLMITVVKRIHGAGRLPLIDDDCSESEEDDEDEEDASEEDDLTDGDASLQTRRIRRKRERAAVGSGKRCRRKKLEYVPGKSIIESALIRIPKYDNMCLFYALAVARKYNIAMHDVEKKEAGRTRSQISCDAYHQTERLVKNHKRLKVEAFEMMDKANIPQGRPSYGWEDARKVQEFFNTAYPGLIRIVIFGKNSGTKSLSSLTEVSTPRITSASTTRTVTSTSSSR